MPVITLTVPGMACRWCVREVTARLRDLPGVETVAADAASCLVIVEGATSEDEVRAALAEVGYPPQGR